jgi:hypothetical protein
MAAEGLLSFIACCDIEVTAGLGEGALDCCIDRQEFMLWLIDGNMFKPPLCCWLMAW